MPGATERRRGAARLEENGYAEVIKTFGTAPYDFNAVQLTSRRRFEAERLMDAAKAADDESSPDERAPVDTTPAGESRPPVTVTRFAQPVGSPFGFTVADWEAVSLDHDDATRLIVASAISGIRRTLIPACCAIARRPVAAFIRVKATSGV